jgi:NAD(P)-dependent dehydrogenase (short-subunit alcohol dehydrogenase family)
MDHTIVIGAGSGIGARVAQRIARAGHSLLLHTGSNRDGLEAVAQTCRSAGANVDLCLGDLDRDATFTGIDEWMAGVAAGTLTGIVFAAGYAKTSAIAETSPEDLAVAFQRMPLAFHRLVRSVAPKLMPKRGRIVCVSAFGPHRPRYFRYFATAPAKAALEAQIRTFAAEFASRGISCNAVAPGFIAKEAGRPSSLNASQWQAIVEEIPMGRLGTSDEVAAAIELLLSAEAGYITGQVLHVDGGLML